MLSSLITSNSKCGRLLRSFISGTPTDPSLKHNHDYFASLDQDQPLTDYSFVVVDTELTGLNAKKDEIVSIGAVRIKDLSVDPSSNFYTLCHPRGPMPKLSTLIHRITPEEVKEAPRLHVVMPKFVEFCDESLIVGHHIGLDLSFLNRAARATLGGHLMNPCIDTMRLAQVYQEELWENYYDQYELRVSYNLRELSKNYGLPLFPEHNAMQDALQTAYLFLYLVKKLRHGGIETLRDLYMAGRSWRWYF